MASTLRLLKNKITRALVREEIDPEELLSWVSSATARLSSELRVADMVTRASIPLTKDIFFLPPDYVATKMLSLTDLNGRPLVGSLIYAPPEDIKSMSADVRTGLPAYYTFYGREVAVSPFTSPNLLLDLRYYREIPPLLKDDDTNFVLDRSPDVYLNFALVAGHKFFYEEASAQARLADALLEVQRLNQNYESNRYGDGPLVMRPTRKMGGRHS